MPYMMTCSTSLCPLYRFTYSATFRFSNEDHAARVEGNDGCNSVPNTKIFDLESTFAWSNMGLDKTALTENAHMSSIITLLTFPGVENVTEFMPLND